MKQKQDIDIRRARIGDLRGIMEIKNDYIDHTSAMWRTRHVGMEEMLLWWGEHNTPARPIFVAAEGAAGGYESIVGYASLSTFRQADGYRYTAENSVYLLPGYEGRGLGRALMRQVLLEGAAAGLRIITAWIDSENQKSVAFHGRLGFQMVGTMRDVGMIGGESRHVTIMDLDLQDMHGEEQGGSAPGAGEA